MENFIYNAPTKVYFGKGEQNNVGKIIKDYGFKKILLHYGSGSVKKSGLYDCTVNSLRASEIEFIELSGVQPNPKLSLVREGAKICKENAIELILAVGGGSVIDSSKAIAIAAKVDFDFWKFHEDVSLKPCDSIPVGTILTIAAAGSETSTNCVITNDATGMKRGLKHIPPLFSILNPELTFSVSKYQTACGIVDIMMHTLERYMTYSDNVSPTDEICEGLLRSVIKNGRIAIDNPCDYEARASLMWAGSLSHVGLTGLGRHFFMISHQIEHEISGMYDRVAHGAGLAVVFPAWMKFAYKYAPKRFYGYAVKVWGCEENTSDVEGVILEGIRRTEEYFRDIGMPTRLSDLDIHEDTFSEMAEKCTNYGHRTLPGYINYTEKEIIEILNIASK